MSEAERTVANVERVDDMRKSRLSHQTLGALLWTFSGRAANLLLRTATIVILARLLRPADFGVVAAALTIVRFSEIFALLGVGPAIVQRTQLEERHLRTGFTFSVLSGILLASVIWLSAPVVAKFYQSDDILPILRFIALVFPLSGITVVAESLMQRNLQFRRLAGVELVSYTAGTGIVGISLAFAGFGAWALVIAYLAEEIVKAVAVLVAQPHPKKPQFEVQAFRELIYFGGGSTIANIFTYIGTQGDNMIVGRWLGMNALGLYGRAYNLMVIPVGLFGTVVTRVLFPVMSRVQNDAEALKRAYRRATALVGLITLPLSVVSCILAPELIYVLLGPAWSAIVMPFRILIVGMLFRTGYVISATLARAKGAVYRNAWRQGIYAALIVGGAWIGQHWGISGVALAVLVVLAIHFLIMAHLGLSLVSFTWRQLWAIHAPAILFSLVIGIEVWGIVAILRNNNVAPLSILALCAVIGLPTGLLLIRLIPFYVLGSDGVWLIHTLIRRLPKNLSFTNWLDREAKWKVSHD